MAARNEYLHYVLEQLSGLGGVSSRRMFGGFGLYYGSQFFGLIFGDTLYFKVGDANRADYEVRGLGRFRPYRDRPQLSMSYYELPADVLEDAQELVVWARRAVEAALSSARLKQPLRRSKAKRVKSRRRGA